MSSETNWQKRQAGHGGFHTAASQLSTHEGTERVRLSCVLVLRETLATGNKHLERDCDFLPNSVRSSNVEAKV